jgi:hypothetical protein
MILLDVATPAFRDWLDLVPEDGVRQLTFAVLLDRFGCSSDTVPFLSVVVGCHVSSKAKAVKSTRNVL